MSLFKTVSKRLNAPYRSGPSKAWIKVKNPKAPGSHSGERRHFLSHEFIWNL
jgi:hypothetical protein